jgi:RHS repeat-associated protein
MMGIMWSRWPPSVPFREATVRDVIDSTGTVVDHITYSAFGAPLSQTNSAVDFLFGYTGRYFDAETGLQWNQNRWYNPTTQRWLTPDPLGLGPDSNPYRYCGNGPTNATDPAGTEGIPTDVFNASMAKLEELQKSGKMSKEEYNARKAILENLQNGKHGESAQGCSNWVTGIINGAYGGSGPGQAKAECNAPATYYSTKTPYDTDAFNKEHHVKSRSLPKESQGKQPLDEKTLLPGDQVWFYNPYWDGQAGMEEGCNTFVVGYDAQGNPLFYNRNASPDGKGGFDNYNPGVMTADQYREWMGKSAVWKTTPKESNKNRLTPTKDYPIVRVRRPGSGASAASAPVSCPQTCRPGGK